MPNGASDAGRASRLYCGLVRERGTVRTSTNSVTSTLCRSATNSEAHGCRGRWCRTVASSAKSLSGHRWRASARQVPQRPPFMQGDVVGPVAPDLILRVVRARVMDVALVVHVALVDAQDRAPHPTGLRIPADVIADLESFRHEELRERHLMQIRRRYIKRPTPFRLQVGCRGRLLGRKPKEFRRVV